MKMKNILIPIAIICIVIYLICENYGILWKVDLHSRPFSTENKSAEIIINSSRQSLEPIPSPVSNLKNISLDSLSAILNKIKNGNLNEYSYDYLLDCIYSEFPSDSQTIDDMDDWFIKKSILLSYIGTLNPERALVFYDYLLTDDGLNTFKKDLKASEAFGKYSNDYFKLSVMARVVDGLAFTDTPEARAKLENYLHNPIKFKSKENCFLNKTFESCVVSALWVNDVIRKNGLEGYISMIREPMQDLSNYDGIDKYRAIADKVKEDFSCE